MNTLSTSSKQDWGAGIIGKFVTILDIDVILAEV
jgi:hypothetical protein